MSDIKNDAAGVNPTYDSLRTALAYLAQHPDHYLFPLGAGRKGLPLIRDNLAQASNSPAQIKLWARQKRFHGCWWGLSAAKSGIVPVDIDMGPGKQGRETIETLKAAGFTLTKTLIQITPSGGRHFIYKGEHHFACGGQIGLHVDVPNYVVIAGCGHYCLSSKSGEIVDVPQWIADKIKRRKNDQPREASADAVSLDLFQRMLKATPYTGGPEGLDDRHGYEGWLTFAMSCHEAAGGDEDQYLHVFVEWCLDDPEAKETWTAEGIERHWQSFDTDEAVSRGSWFKVLKHFGHADLVGETLWGSATADRLRGLRGGPV